MTYLAALSDGSRKTQRNALEAVARYMSLGKRGYRVFGWEHMTYRKMMQVRTWLTMNHKPATARRMLAAVRRVIKECYRHELIDRERYDRLVDLDPIRGRSEPPGRYLETEELRKLWAATGDHPIGLRDRAIIAMMYGTGLRSVEVVRMLLRDIADDLSEALVRGKGSLERVIPVPCGAWELLTPWLEARGNRHGPMFCSAPTVRKMTMRPMTTDGVYQMVVRLGEKAGLERVTPHDLRRTYITGLLDASVDPVVTSKLAGHAKVDTTVLYDRRPKTVGAEAVERLGW